MEEIRTKVRSYISRSLRNKNFDDSEDLFRMGLFHSLFAVQLIVFIEKNFGIEVNDEDLDLNIMRSINDIVAFIQRKTEKAG